MSFQKPLSPPTGQTAFITAYLDALSLVERLHRLLLDVIKDEFERLGILDINAVQGLLLFNIGDHEVTAGELKTRGYYQGSNVSYNLKTFVKYWIKGEGRRTRLWDWLGTPRPPSGFLGTAATPDGGKGGKAYV